MHLKRAFKRNQAIVMMTLFLSIFRTAKGLLIRQQPFFDLFTIRRRLSQITIIALAHDHNISDNGVIVIRRKSVRAFATHSLDVIRITKFGIKI